MKLRVAERSFSTLLRSTTSLIAPLMALLTRWFKQWMRS